ncbi:MAG: class I SAM-dependent DNA methyltransferase [Pseudomonadota bacterium]|nr:class I SAM-dependent DNA methyltransferase [Pseudomonadota bacterium]
MTPADFIRKWERSTLSERAASQSHFNDLCDLLGEKKPTDVDQTGEEFCFEKGATKATGGNGFADVWKKGCFGWEYKGPHKDLDAAHRQLLNYSVALENPPLLIVSDTKKIVIRTNWTNTVGEKHEIALTDLIDANKRALLKAAFEDPEKLKPKKTRTQLTAEAANEFSGLAQRLRDRGHDPHEVAHFVNRLVFCMFAEDARLLPDNIFTKMLEHCVREPGDFEESARTLFAAMRTQGGRVGFEKIEWFNGGLFDDDHALPLDEDDIRQTLKAARLDWQEIDPSILGTLFERGLDPSKRSQLGAHYTDRDKIMMIVNPVIVEPLTAEWIETKAKIEALLEKAPKETKDRLLRGKDLAARTKALNEAEKLHKGFIERLVNFRVLDPACGSGNFLYLSLQALKDLEHRANLDSEALGLPRAFPRVGPEAVKGIEINPYAAELARVSVWIGEIQWMLRNGFDAGRNPILKPLDTIECRDALIEKGEDGAWREAEWPDADVIVGNPPFLGDRKMIGELGEQYVFALREIFKERVPGGADLVCYWYAMAWRKIADAKTHRSGLVATNSISGGANREVLKTIVKQGRIFDAWEDEPWVVDGAAVRVAIVCFDGGAGDAKLNGARVSRIYSDLRPASQDHNFDLTQARKLKWNRDTCFIGTMKNGPFNISYEQALEWLEHPNPHGVSNASVLRPWTNGQDITRRPSGQWIIDFGAHATREDSALFEAPFKHVLENVYPKRKDLRRKAYRENWWRYQEPQPKLRRLVDSLPRMIVSPRVSKHRIFVFRHSAVNPDSATVAIARDDDTTFGILHSKFHEIWSLRMCTWLGVGNDPRYTPTTCFETFPFPEGLTPDIPAADYASDPRAVRIAEAAAKLNELRENWLNPPDLVKRVPEVVPGYPDRILPVDEKAEKILKKRTLTNLYNERPAWLDHAHRALDEAVAAAYGWEADFRAGALTEEEILKRLFELNQARAKAQ